jgi:antirestriction protein ArdC
MATQSPDRVDVYTRITDQIIKAIELGAEKWEMPWQSVDTAFRYPENIATGKRYRGVNVLALWAESHIHGYPEAVWGTYKQWTDLGRQVARGQKASIGVFWKPLDVRTAHDPRDADGASDVDRAKRWIARAFPLFNAAQVEGYEPPPEPPLPPEQQRVSHAEAFFAALNADIRHGGNRAFYRTATDHIQMPSFAVFADPLAYYSTLAHEVTHWTGHPSRLARELTGRFGSESYAAEELIAELGAAFIAADLGLSPDSRAENAAYIDNWLKVLKSDNRAIFTAASLAQRAADYIHRLQLDIRPESHPSTRQLSLTL